MLRLTPHAKMPYDPEGLRIDDIDRIAAAVGYVNEGGKLLDHGAEVARPVSRVDIIRIEHLGHSCERRSFGELRDRCRSARLRRSRFARWSFGARGRTMRILPS